MWGKPLNEKHIVYIAAILNPSLFECVNKSVSAAVSVNIKPYWQTLKPSPNSRPYETPLLSDPKERRP